MCIHSVGDAAYYVKAGIQNGYKPGTRAHRAVCDIANTWGIDLPESFLTGVAPPVWTPPKPVSVNTPITDEDIMRTLALA